MYQTNHFGSSPASMLGTLPGSLRCHPGDVSPHVLWDVFMRLACLEDKMLMCYRGSLPGYPVMMEDLE